MKIHKTHAKKRKTVCGINYDDVKDLISFVNNNLAGHWRRVTCKNCSKIGKGDYMNKGKTIKKKEQCYKLPSQLLKEAFEKEE